MKNDIYIAHHGILGMRWGVRRYQNKDGSLTPAGAKHVAKRYDELQDLASERAERKMKNHESSEMKQIRKEHKNTYKNLRSYQDAYDEEYTRLQRKYFDKSIKDIEESHIKRNKAVALIAGIAAISAAVIIKKHRGQNNQPSAQVKEPSHISLKTQSKPDWLTDKSSLPSNIKFVGNVDKSSKTITGIPQYKDLNYYTKSGALKRPSGRPIKHNDFNNTDYLYHHGIKGMKWGVRRYTNEDGTLTEVGKKRYYNMTGDSKYNEDGYVPGFTKLNQVENSYYSSASKHRSNVIENETYKYNQASYLLKNTQSALDQTANLIPNKSAKKVRTKSYSNISDSELQARISRLQKENTYADLVGDVKYEKPKSQYVRETIQTVGALTGIALTGVTIAKLIKEIKVGNRYDNTPRG